MEAVEAVDFGAASYALGEKGHDWQAELSNRAVHVWPERVEVYQVLT